jgi:phytoene desaturase
MERSHTLKIVVIGAGVGGMCAAARLAKAGHSVTVYEGSDRVGGKLRTEWIGRYAFDTGPSLLTLPAVYRDFFLKTGKHMGQEMEVVSVNPSFDYRFADGSQVKFANLSRFETLKAITESFSEESAKQWDSLMRVAEKMWDISREPFIESELNSPFSLLKRPTFIKDLFAIAPWKTLRQLADEELTDIRLRFILDRYATYSGSDPRKAPAVLSSIAFVEETFGAWHIKGGLGTMADAIYERCIKHGVTFHLSTPVQEIILTKGDATGLVLANGERVESDAVISNADASFTYNSLIKSGSRRVKRVRKKLAKTEASLAGFYVLLGLRASDEPQLEHHTILFPKNYDLEFDSIFSAKKPVEKPTIYICSPHDAAMVKSENSVGLFVLVNAPVHSEDPAKGWDWSDEKFNVEYANSIIDQIEARGISIRDRLETITIRTPLQLQESVNAPGGSIYGSSSNGARAAFLRAKNKSPIKGLYFVGGSAHPGGGLPLVGISAELVANAIGSARNAQPNRS